MKFLERQPALPHVQLVVGREVIGLDRDDHRQIVRPRGHTEECGELLRRHELLGKLMSELLRRHELLGNDNVLLLHQGSRKWVRCKVLVTCECA
jgi:hypothetical protein